MEDTPYLLVSVVDNFVKDCNEPLDRVEPFHPSWKQMDGVWVGGALFGRPAVPRCTESRLHAASSFGEAEAAVWPNGSPNPRLWRFFPRGVPIVTSDG